MSKSPNRFQTCVNSRCQLKTINRDENGAQNIEVAGLAQHFPTLFEKPENMKRQVKQVKIKDAEDSKQINSKERKQKHKQLKKELKKKNFEKFKESEGRSRIKL